MSEENSKIITGLRLSEAIKYCEENTEVQLKSDAMTGFAYFKHISYFDVDETYSVKLPPPKSVSVTRADAKWAHDKSYIPSSDGKTMIFDFEIFCKELGL